jgi:hypothetical protein
MVRGGENNANLNKIGCLKLILNENGKTVVEIEGVSLFL